MLGGTPGPGHPSCLRLLLAPALHRSQDLDGPASSDLGAVLVDQARQISSAMRSASASESMTSQYCLT
jgi:hypothetical protein